MNNILIPTDFSENAFNALQYAVALFGSQECTFHLMHSFEEQSSQLTSRIDIGKSEDVMAELYHEADEHCFALKTRIQETDDDPRHKFECVSTSLAIHRAIVKYGNNHNIDLVVMGTQGMSDASDVILGSNTIKVIKKVENLPVLIVPVGYSFKVPKQIAFATAFKKVYREKELKPLLQIIKMFKADLTIMHVKEDHHISREQSLHLQELIDLLRDIQISVSWLKDTQNKTQSIVDHLEEENYDLLAMIYYKHNFITQIFRESIVKKIGRRPEIPYLVIPSLS